MKKLKTFYLFDKSYTGTNPRKVRAGAIFKSLLFMLLIFWITILSSCAVIVPVPGDEGRGGHREHDEHFGHNDHNDHHDQDRHHD